VIVRRVEVPDIGDSYNTILKMAKKRAYIDAILSATAASDIFTQDLEDFASGSDESETGQSKDIRSHQEEGNASPERETISGILSDTNSNQYKGRTYYFGKIGNENLMTSEAEIGSTLIEAEGQQIEAVCVARPNKGPNHYRLLSFTYTEHEAVAVSPSQPDQLNDEGTQIEVPF
jgi:hypothetical protein